MNNLIAQLRDLFQSMTPGARITAGLLLVVAVVSVAYLFQNTAAGPDAFLFGGERFSQGEINRMEAAMAEARITGWQVEGNRIAVPTSKQQECIAAIASAGALPDNFATFMDAAIDRASPMESRQQWELRTKVARENQLSLIVSKMDWVESAHVMVDIQERRGFNQRNNASASVFITPKPGEVVDRVRVRNIQKLVAGPFASMTLEKVNVTSSNGDIGGGSEQVYDDQYLQARSEVMKSYRQSILTGLNFIPGVRVEVSADLDNKKSMNVTTITPSDGKTVRSETQRETEQSTVNDGGGQPGAPANGPSRRGLEEGLARTNSSTLERETSTEENAVGQETTQELFVGFKPKELRASIAVPREYVQTIWMQKNPEGDPTKLTDTERQTMESALKLDIERYVQNILPRLSLGEDEYRQVEVIFIDSIKQPLPPEPSVADTALAWTGEYWGTLSMLGLAGVSLLLLRSAIRPSTTTNPTAAPAMEVEFGSKSNESTDSQDPQGERPKLRIKKTESLKEDLSEMVREDPDAAASILRGWIHNAA